jgi:splicing factor 1
MLATLNGTLRDDEGQTCQNCKPLPPRPVLVLTLGGEIGHRKYDCPQIRNFNANVVCRRCGQAGHFAKDCKVNLVAQGGYGAGVAPAGPGASDFDKEYQELMAEVGGGGGIPGGISYQQPVGRIESGGGNPWGQSAPAPQVASIAPWKAATPWTAQPTAPPPPPPGPGYAPAPPPGMSSVSSSFGPPPSLGPPPGLSSSMGYPGAMPPPPMGAFPPPPPRGYAPPPPPGGVPPPPPPPM